MSVCPDKRRNTNTPESSIEMERIILTSLLLTAVVSSSAGALRQYHFVSQQRNWTEAQKYCREKHTDLVTINDMQEQNDTKQAIERVNSNVERVWIGLKSTNTWIWSRDPAFYSGGDLRYKNWENSQPKGNGDCVFMNNEGKWNDRNCSFTKYFICYNDKLVLVSENKTWAEAVRHCRNNDMDLVSVDSEQMQQQVMNMIINASSTLVWLGLRHSCTVGIWFWVNGQTVCYDQWTPDYDKDLNECEKTVRSGAIRTNDTRWISRPETDRYNFICSK
ncbi:hypothetical protein QQF64_020203 [Cirrhinus molitorella]|uniref:C-type lectin domain-containing protein n=1 Tax=Cirrhinus molitorella TaxID=172907 RepID=A0ABR3LCE0_9TELE